MLIPTGVIVYVIGVAVGRKGDGLMMERESFLKNAD